MKKIRTLIIVSSIVLISDYMLSFAAESIYMGVDFIWNLEIIIFNIINFCCLSTIIKCSDNCLFKKNLACLLRMNSRKKALLKEIAKRLIFTIIYIFLNILLVSIFESLSGNKLNCIQFIPYCFVNLTTLSLILLIQLSLDIFINSNCGYFLVNVIYVVGLISGQMMYDYCNRYENTISVFLKNLNQLNIVNYLSIPRIEKLDLNIYFIGSICSILFILVNLIILYKIKKFDILSKE